jgi:hypothetical protein
MQYPEAEIIIFGSRTDITKKGRHRYTFVSNKIDYRSRRKIRVEILLKLGERKIDLIITDDPEKSEFIKTAYK